MINKPPPPNRDYNRDPNIQAHKRKRFLNQGSTLKYGLAWEKLGLLTIPFRPQQKWGRVFFNFGSTEDLNRSVHLKLLR